jgi:hypothetical protein
MCGSLSSAPLGRIGHNADLLKIMAELPDQSPVSLSKPDLESIEQFARGKKKSIPGASLRIEYADNAIKLLDRQNVTVAVSKQVNEWQRKVLLYRHAEAYFEALVARLDDQKFFAAKKSRHPDFAEFSKYETPSGYRLQYQTANLMGQAWLERHSRVLSGQTPSLLIFQGNNWYPIQELKIEHQIMHLRTLIGEVSISTDEPLVWIERIAEQKAVTTSAAVTISASPPETMSQPNPELVPTPIPELSSADRSAELTSPVVNPVQIEQNSAYAETLANLKNTVKLKALARMVDYLNDGDVIVSTETLKNGHDQVMSTKVTEVKRSCPRWVIEQVRQF